MSPSSIIIFAVGLGKNSLLAFFIPTIFILYLFLTSNFIRLLFQNVLGAFTSTKTKSSENF